MTPATSALTGIRVIDFTHVYQGPVGTQLLADYGADVIKIERPEVGDWSRRWGPFVKGVSLPFAGLNRNKRSVAIDVKNLLGRQAIFDLVKSADVVVHNFRAGIMEKLGFGYEDFSTLNPRLVYAWSGGWGDEGPSANRARGGHDLMARAEAGWFVQPDLAKPPIPAGISADYAAGLMLMQGILMALLARQRTGKGQRVTTDLLSVAFHAHSWEGPAEMNAARVTEVSGVSANEAIIDKSFATKDGYIEITNPMTQAEGRITFLQPLWEDFAVIFLDPDYRYTVVGLQNRTYIWFFAREPQIGDEMYRAMLKAARANGFEVAHILRFPQRPEDRGAPGDQ